MSKTILATFRINQEAWETFKKQCSDNGSNASSNLKTFVLDSITGNNKNLDKSLESYLENNLDKFFESYLENNLDKFLDKNRGEKSQFRENL